MPLGDGCGSVHKPVVGSREAHALASPVLRRSGQNQHASASEIQPVNKVVSSDDRANKSHLDCKYLLLGGLK